jgi:hypothetical protein
MEEHMKGILIAITCLLPAGAALSGQTPAKSTAKPVGLGKSVATSNEDLNIRAYIELLRTDVKKAKAQLMGEVMELDADQAATFWPIYKEFETELSSIGDQIAALIMEYAANYEKMTGAAADQLAGKILDIEQQRTVLKKKYYQRVKEAIDPITAARFLQVENQLERLIDLQITAQLPVIH